MEFEKLLNQEQLKGVISPCQYIRVIAGAGSGKTRVLTYRIAYLIENNFCNPKEILGITFTNKAAKEIKDRVLKLYPYAYNMSLSTIHSWCAKFLRYNANKINYPRNFTILDEEDTLSVFKGIFVSHGLPKNDPHIKECMNWIGKKKTDGIQYRDIKDTKFPNPLYNQFLIYFKEYTEILENNHSLDFDDLLLKSIQILEENIELREATARRYRHILVDEFQDINDVQFYLIRLLMNEESSLYVVGDPDQTIYTWRGANNKIMLNLEDNLKTDYPSCRVENIVLVNNYRSTKNILDGANKLISNNQERIKKDLFAVNPNGDEILYYNARTINEEASYIATTIDDFIRKDKMKYSQFAILYRSNYLTREIESQLVMRRIPYKIFGGLKFYQRKEIKDILAYLTLIDNPDNDIALERIINVPKRNLGPTTVDKMKMKAKEFSQPLYLFLKESIDELELPKSKVKEVNKLIDIIDQTRDKINFSPSKDYSKIVEELIDNIAYYNYLKDDDLEDERKNNVLELVATITYFFNDNPDGKFFDFIENATLQASADEVNEGDYVSLMTVHIAKGLEYDNVFVYSLNEGTFPSKRALEEKKNGIEEERRLAYVAYTRARKRLFLTSNNDYSYVTGGNLKPSRFIEEAGIKIKKNTYQDRYNNSYINPYLKSSYTMKEEKKKVVEEVKTNGVTSWSIGDRISHETFGTGLVVDVVSDKLIKVKFDDALHGTKTLLSNHIKIKKLYN